MGHRKPRKLWQAWKIMGFKCDSGECILRARSFGTSRIEILRIDSICVLLGAIPFSE